MTLSIALGAKTASEPPRSFTVPPFITNSLTLENDSKRLQ
jgi:hypothetical protein